MRSTCWRATTRPRSATCATMPTPRSSEFDSPMARRPAGREPGALWRRAARGGDLRLGAVAGHGQYRGRLLPHRLRLAAARRRRHAGARRRDQADAGGGAGDDPLRRRRSAPRRATPAPRTRPGCCSPPAPSSKATRHPARRQRLAAYRAVLDARHRRRAARPADHHRQPERRSAGGGGHHGRGARRSRCRPAATASPSSAPTTSSTAARPTSPRRRRTSATWSCSRSTELNDWAVARAGQRPVAGRLRDRQSAARQQRRPDQLPVAGADRGGASRVPRRPLHRGVRPRRRAPTATSRWPMSCAP